ncbi:MAG: WD40-repeat-containing domain protein [Monoraphidium minutum]|nr:MAG: WD40-repeat-containing domain protein [Monoraphidium minutum]
MFSPSHGGHGGGSSGSAHSKKEPRLTVVFQHTDEDLHCAAVEALVASTSGDLFTASRDSTIRRWDFSSGRPVCAARFEGHADWVNGLAAVGPDVLVSCSSDRTVKLWRAAGKGECIHTFADAHSDYITRVAAAEQAGLVASAGLRSEIVLYDLAAMKALPLRPPSGGAGGGAPRENGAGAAGSGGGTFGKGPSAAVAAAHQQQQQHPQQQHQQQQQQQPAAAGPKGSIYALAMNPAGTLLAAGTTESFIRVYDPRSHAKAMKLKGHTDNIRALLMNDAGTLLLSAASDDTVRLWDMRQQRCSQTLALHTDSVWCLAATPDFGAVISGGRDGRVLRTHLARRETQLLVQTEAPVRAMALTADEARLWVSASSPAVAAYHLPPWPPQAPAGATCARSASLSRSFLGGSPALRLRQSIDLTGAAAEGRASAAPAVTIPGAAALVAHRVLPDKRHVLTQDSGGAVARWDVLSGGIVENYGKADLAATERALWRAVSVPSWFTADVRLGQLAVHLDPPGCFAAEAYALDLGIRDAQDDAKLNLGACLLRNAMRHWAVGFSEAHMSGAPIPGLDGAAWPGMPCFREAAPPSVISQDARGLTWRRPFTSFTGQEPADAYVPGWVANAVLRSTFPFVKELKAAFVLAPAEGSGLPSLIQPRLNAPRILQVKKVANYCASKLSELGFHATPLEVTWDPDSRLPPPPGSAAAQEQQQQQGEGGAAAEGQQQQSGGGGSGEGEQQQQRQYLEITCNGMAVPCELSVAAVKKFIWRRSDDVLFIYRLLDPATIAPMPKVEPPT